MFIIWKNSCGVFLFLEMKEGMLYLKLYFVFFDIWENVFLIKIVFFEEMKVIKYL